MLVKKSAVILYQFKTKWPEKVSHVEAKTIKKMWNFFWPLGLKLVRFNCTLLPHFHGYLINKTKNIDINAALKVISSHYNTLYVFYMSEWTTKKRRSPKLGGDYDESCNHYSATFLVGCLYVEAMWNVFKYGDSRKQIICKSFVLK